MENLNFATEILMELKSNCKRWFIIATVALSMWLLTIGGFIWYISMPVEVSSCELATGDGGNANYIGESLNGDLNNGKN